MAFVSPNATGNLIVAYVVWSNVGTATVSDSRGNVYAAAQAPTPWSGNRWSAQVFYARNVAAGPNTVTATFGTPITFGILYIHEYAGIHRLDPLEASRSATGTGAAMSSGTATTTNASDLIFGAGASSYTVTQAGSGFTTRSTAYGNRTQDRNVTAPGSYSATATQDGDAWVMQMVAFKADPGDVTPPTTPTGLSAAAVSTTGIDLAWTPSTDDVGVAGYRVHRDGVQVATTIAAAYSDTGLATGTSYTYTVTAFDAAGNASAPSAPATATTQVPPPDTTPPTTPSDLQATAVSPTQVDLTWSPSIDDVGVVGYDVFRDGVLLTTVGSTAYSNVNLTPGTAYTYWVRARDAAGNVSALSASATVTTPSVDVTPPTVAISSPVPGATVSGTVVVVAGASDDVAVVGVQFMLDGVPLGAEDATTPYSVSWNTTGTANGLHQLTARARDAAGNVTLSASRDVTVANVASPGLVAGYAFDEGTGTTAGDASGNGLLGTLMNGAGWGAGRYGTATALDGVDSHVALGNPAALRMSGSMTLSAWIRPTTHPGDDGAIVSKRGAIGYQLDTTVDTGVRTVGFKLTNSSGSDMIRYGVTTLQVGSWTHVAGVYDAAAATMDVYVNGVRDNGVLLGIVTGSQLDSPDDVRIGLRASGGFGFNGLVDDVRIYARALSATEVQTDMNTPLASGSSSDGTPPTVVLTAPASGAQVSGIVSVTAEALDDVGVAGVQFLVDGAAAGLEDAVAPYGLAWDSRTVPNGSHVLTARARDAAGNTALSAPVTVNVANTSDFQNEILATGFSLPTCMKFLPDGRLLVAELQGTIRILAPPYLQADPTLFLQLTNVGSAGVQQGIYDIALDPQFATNRYYYVFYTLGSPNRDRLSRFTANATLTGTVAGSELVLYQDPQDANAEHHGGAVNFGNDGKIYFTTGEHFQAGESQLLSSPRGKIHRINPDGTVPTDNPFYDGAGPNWDSVWALGLRNPYRAYYDAATGRLFIGDVGGNDYATAVEEVNVGERGANFGWPDSEGPCAAPCRSPLYSYPHSGRDAAVTGGFVYRGTQFPPEYQGAYFFADYTQNWIRFLTFDAAGNLAGVFAFEPPDGTLDGPYGDIVYLTQGPEGALYYLDLGYSDIGGTFGVSKLRRIRYVQSNQAPVAVASASPLSGPTPLTVAFSSAGSADPEGQPLAYAWAFGDGTTSTAANPTHTYGAAGVYLARLTVSDGVNSTVAPPLSIAAGNPPSAAITTPLDGTTFRAGDVISFSGTGSDPEDGVLPASAFTWNVDFLHEGHVHPGIPLMGVTGGSFIIPTSGHDFSGDTRYRITLTVTDSTGLTATRAVTIYPLKVNLTFATLPSGLTLYLDGIARVAPFVHDTLVGFEHVVEARDQAMGGTSYAFVSWSDGGAQQHTVVVPSVDQGYTATYTALTTPPAPPGFIQVASATPQTPQGTVTTAFTGAQSAGNLNVVVVGWNDTTASIASVTDTAGNAYAIAAPVVRGSGLSQAIYHASNIWAAAAGANAVQVTFTQPAVFVDVRIAEYSGIDPLNPLDGAASAAGSSSSPDSGPVTASSPTTLLVGAGTTTGGFSGAGTGWTLRIITQPDSDILEDRVVTGGGSYSAAAPLLGTSAWVMQVVAFRAGP